MPFSIPVKAQFDDDLAYTLCIEAAEYYESFGREIDKKTWCSDISSVPEAVCRDAGIVYKLYYADLNVKDYCLGVSSLEYAYCIQENLDKKGRTGLPVNVKDHCK